jgi:hypothetical protein
VLAQQFWWKTYTRQMSKEEHPNPITPGDQLEKIIKEIRAANNLEDDRKERLISRFEMAAAGAVLLQFDDDSTYVRSVTNVSFSTCYNCNKVSVWIYDRLVWPATHSAQPANPDVPDDVRTDYDEAGLIVGLSPRGAAALLRLAIQKLMPHLGQSGKDLNSDIGNLVARGLHVHIQRALDIVRVIGNNAVHPGHIDLKDDHATATELFALVNVIVDAMITQPKKIEALYASLPPSAREQIEDRAKKTK